MAVLLTLTQAVTERQKALLPLWLNEEDSLLLRENARALARHPKPARARGYLRASDAAALGGALHADWKVISDADWVALVEEQSTHVTW